MNIVENILNMIKKQNLSVLGLEKKAGLKVNAVNNIIKSVSANPTIKTIAAIANALNCSIDELVFGDQRNYQTQKDKQLNTLYENWNSDLDIKCRIVVYDLLNKKSLRVTNDQLQNICNSLYKYTIKKNTEKHQQKDIDYTEIVPDENYAEYVIEHVTNNL